MIPIDSEALVILSKLTDQDSGDIVEDATVTGSLKTAEGIHIADFDFVNKGSGKYNGVIGHDVTADLVQGTNYMIEVLAVWGINQSVFRKTDVAEYQP